MDLLLVACFYRDWRMSNTSTSPACFPGRLNPRWPSLHYGRKQCVPQSSVHICHCLRHVSICVLNARNALKMKFQIPLDHADSASRAATCYTALKSGSMSSTGLGSLRSTGGLLGEDAPLGGICSMACGDCRKSAGLGIKSGYNRPLEVRVDAELRYHVFLTFVIEQ